MVLADIHKGDLVRCKSACQQAHPSGGDAIVSVPTDVSILADVLALKEIAFKQFKRVDFLMNNAAIQNNGDASAITHMDRWTDVLSVNLMGVSRPLHRLQYTLLKQVFTSDASDTNLRFSLKSSLRAQVSYMGARRLARRWWTKEQRR
eukprot:COSAG02_NODE_274_length_26244_cov_36.943507_17_plen_148_part_00